MGNFFTTLFETLGDFFGSVIGFFVDILEFLFSLITSLIDALKELLTYLFVPSEEKLQAIPELIKDRFHFVDTIKETITAMQNIMENMGTSPKLESSHIESKYFTGTLTIIDFSWYAPFKPYGDLVMTGFIYVFFIWGLFTHMANIINGTGGQVISAHTQYINNTKGGKK